eukprot:CAMPEP_0173317226 /NCGR_PEP_ID=MMETSP1143-20121109/26963_1 /TAXON_ID=483371 /ORGANISM="non described non described, Strain CCMP2298" /LENGTH=308 /DNA_ID=CAMNT_0014260295 /DNA_START=78 /DNA_END=1001 /DNA_ORIENTATION=+
MATVAQNSMVQVDIPENSRASDARDVQEADTECPVTDSFETETMVQDTDTECPVTDSFEPETTVEEEEKLAVTAPSSISAKQESKSYVGVAAWTTGVIFTGFIAGPLITGVLVVGMICASQRQKSSEIPQKSEAEDLESGVELVVEGAGGVEVEAEVVAESREKKIARAILGAADYTFEQWARLDTRLGISYNALRAFATVQEMDEKNQISGTVVSRARAIDEQYAVSSNTHYAVSSGLAGAQVVSTKVVSVVQDFDRRYSVTDKVSECGGCQAGYQQTHTQGTGGTTNGPGRGSRRGGGRGGGGDRP